MMTKLPPWTGNDRAMLDWLADIISAEIDEAQSDADEEPDAAELAAARLMRDLGPLKAKYPYLAKAGVLRLPPMGSRKTNKQVRRRAILDGYGYFMDFDDKEHRAIIAANLAPMIRNIWKVHFDGKYYRKQDEKSAEWFAAMILDVLDEAGEADTDAVRQAIDRGAGRSIRS